MKTKLSFFYRNVTAFLGYFIVITVITFSQPQHYNYNTGGAGNNFPFNIYPATGKTIQTLYLPGSFNNPNPVVAGNITKIYFRASGTGNPTFTNLKIRMGLTTDTDLPLTAWYTGTMTTVFDQASYSVSATSGSFFSITLGTPFYYDPAKSLVVEVEQCGFSGTSFAVYTTTTTGQKRHTGPFTAPVPPCPHPWYNTGAFVTHTGIDVAPPPSLPEILYYKFERNPNASTVINCGTTGQGTPTAPISGVTLTPGGQFDSCITGNATTSAGITTGWNLNLGSSSWTIGMWVDITTTTFGYLFGDPGNSFRSFNNGAAGTNGLTLRGTGISNVNLTGFGSGPIYVHFVYDSAAAEIRAYKNGVLSVTVPQTLNLNPGTGFKVGGYSSSAGFTGKMDEFRFYRRALTPAEITATFNTDIGDCIVTSVNNNNNQIPNKYKLEQNYPNPFNPATNITFALPISGNVELKVYDILGREVAALVNSFVNAGTHSVKFDASSLSSGVYIYKITSGAFTDSKKMMLIK